MGCSTAREAAAHGWPRYDACDRIRRGWMRVRDESARVVEDADPYDAAFPSENVWARGAEVVAPYAWCGADSPEHAQKSVDTAREGQAPPLRRLFRCGD